MTCPLHPAASGYGCRHCNARARTHGKDTERSLVGRLTAMLEAERAAHERAERERDEAVENQQRQWMEKDHYRDRALAADVAAVALRSERDEARARVAQLEEALGSVRDDIGVMNTSAHDDAIQACHDHAEQLIRAALSASPSDWLAEHDRSIAERQREACAARVRPLDADPDLSYTSAEILATPLVTK